MRSKTTPYAKATTCTLVRKEVKRVSNLLLIQRGISVQIQIHASRIGISSDMLCPKVLHS